MSVVITILMLTFGYKDSIMVRIIDTSFLLQAVVVVYANAVSAIANSQDLVDYMARNIQVLFKIETNLESSPDGHPRSKGSLELTNIGTEDIFDKDWQLFFCSIRIWHPDVLKAAPPGAGVTLGDTGLVVGHVTGCLHRISSAQHFQGFYAGMTLVVPFETSDWQAARTDVSPNWYVTASDADPRVLFYTQGEELSFVEDFTTPQQWKRREYDSYTPYSAQDRYRLGEEETDDVLPFIPTPHAYTIQGGGSIDLSVGSWIIVADEIDMLKTAQFLAAKLQVSVSHTNKLPASHYIHLTLGTVSDKHNAPVDSPEAYRVNITGAPQSAVTITASDAAGLRHGCVTLIAMRRTNEGGVLPEVEIIDYPRFSYRGMHVDVARHFQPVSSLLRLLDALALYKLNTLHLHLSDDEGWRLQIPALPELTEVGSNQCHDPLELTCLMPQFGSGPFKNDSGSGFYSTEDYKKILLYADDRGIEVIPEFDMPGHARAAIKAMEARHHVLQPRDPAGAHQYLLTDLEDTSQYLSIQSYRDNAINPCLSSTYNFVREVVREVKRLHDAVRPLRTFHFGGDEVPEGAWVYSPACANQTHAQIKQTFVSDVIRILTAEGVSAAAWEDGLMLNATAPFPRDSLQPTGSGGTAAGDVTAYAWNNIWEWGGGSRAYTLANSGYKVVLSHATSLYFDHPEEPDPEERGFYWATRFTDTRNVFNYQPDNIYNNIEVDLWGKPIHEENICRSLGCEVLKPGKEKNIIGMQGQLWSETVRTLYQFDAMVFPRLLALAERAWHRADWENERNPKEKSKMQSEDWRRFANTVGQRELARLDGLGVLYRIPPPGAVITHDGSLHMKTPFPGLQMEWSVNGGASWQLYDRADVKVNYSSIVHLRTRSSDGSRSSRIVSLRTPTTPPASATASRTLWTISAVYVLCLLRLSL